MNKLVVILIVILIPGIVSAVISDKITVHSKWDSFKYGLYSVVFGITIYSFLQIILYSSNIISACFSNNMIWNNLQMWNVITSEAYDVPASEVIFATILSVPIAFLFSWLINFKLFNKVAKYLRITNKYGDENLFSYYLNAKEIDWLYVRDPSNNLTYQGRIMTYSENTDIQEIVLSEVTVYRYEDSAELYSLPTIYLTKKLGEFIIEAIPSENLGIYNGKETAN
ncbi:MAG: hypothetical protein WC209_10115 [Ignavibacteriaceae bacterium]|jgi:hypothetical protein